MASDFNPLSLLSSPITGAFDLAGAKDQADAMKQASQLQAQAAQAALQFTEQKQAQAEQQAAPYLALGQQAVTQLPSIARQAPTYGAPAPYTTQPMATAPMTGSYKPQPTSLAGMAQPIMSGPMQTRPVTAQQVQGGGGAVLMQGPDGSTKQVPAEQVQFWQQRGARIVGGS